MAQNPNVKIEIQAIENDAFKPKLTTVTQSGDAPDIFQTWGGGVLAQQAEVGLVKDLTNDVSSWFGNFQEVIAETYKADGKIYAVPYDAGMVGIWYNKKLFKEAGIEEVPETWSEFIDAVKKLKAANITPIALAGGESWTAHFYWAYLVLRIGGLDALKQAEQTRDFSGPAFVELPAPVTAAKRCRLELDNGSGATMRVQLVGYDAADIEALSRGFWGAR